jgi:hypothetical protein
VRFSDDIIKHINSLDSKIYSNEWSVFYHNKFKHLNMNLPKLNIVFKRTDKIKGEYNNMLKQITINLDIMSRINNVELTNTLKHEYFHFLDFICMGNHRITRYEIESELKRREIINTILEECVENKSKLSKYDIRQKMKEIKKGLCYDNLAFINSKNELNVRTLVILSNIFNIKNYTLAGINEYVFKELKNDINLDDLYDESISFIQNKIKNIYFSSNK